MRLKYENREIILRSPRTYFSSAISSIVISFKKRRIDPSNHDSLSPGCSLAMKVAREYFQDNDIVPIQLYNTINSDNIGRFLTEGILVQSLVLKNL